ncbi:MAG: hypothetical protein ABIT05_02285 [Chitinophagaceae bacterium]
MEHKNKLEELNKDALQKLDDYVKTKTTLKEEHHEQLNSARHDWQLAWSKLMEILTVLERIEI